MAVIVVIDQMREDYLDRYAGEFKYGLKHLVASSTRYSNARLNHVPTETAPGHATISTGKAPSQHGIIGNEWFDRERGKIISAVSDPDFTIGPGRLMSPTLGDVLKSTSPASKVVSISFKDRAAIFLGGKKADNVIWFDKKSKKFVTSAAYPAPGAWLDQFNTTSLLRSDAMASPVTDELTWKLAKLAFLQNQLGKDEHCDILLIGFSATDLIGHDHGPDSIQMRAQLLSMDKILGELLAFFTTETNGSFILTLTSDHGVFPTPESTKGKKFNTKRVNPKSLQKKLEAAAQQIHPNPKSEWILGTLIPDVYLDRQEIASQNLDYGSFLIQLAAEWKKIPDVAMVYLNNPLIEQDEYNATYQRSIFPGRSGDLSLRMKSGVLITPRLTGTTHGSPYAEDTHVPLLFYGNGFEKAVINSPVSTEIVAPKMAERIGLIFE